MFMQTKVTPRAERVATLTFAFQGVAMIRRLGQELPEDKLKLLRIYMDRVASRNAMNEVIGAELGQVVGRLPYLEDLS